MNLLNFIDAIRVRFNPLKVLRTTPPGKGPNVTPLGHRDPGLYNEAEENQIRLKMAREAYYAEKGLGYDPSGAYRCADCQFRVETDLDKFNGLCSRVDGLISLHTGSCDIFAFGNYASDDQLLTRPDSDLVHGASILTKQQSGYQERPTSKAFGCLRCVHAKRAKYNDKSGRRIWCRLWGAHVASTACCSGHLGKDSVTQFDS